MSSSNILFINIFSYILVIAIAQFCISSLWAILNIKNNNLLIFALILAPTTGILLSSTNFSSSLIWNFIVRLQIKLHDYLIDTVLVLLRSGMAVFFALLIGFILVLMLFFAQKHQ
ncbi:MAG: hypothetical protein AB4911_13800 [Oscillochloridaceae bacterium umkhey_bin13]